MRPGFIAARSWAREHGATFRIATDRSTRTPYLENVRRLSPLRAARIDSAVAARLLATVPGERGVVLGTMWRMIARRELGTDLSVPIGLHTRLAIR